MIRSLVVEAVAAGARRWRACEMLGISIRTLERWGNDREDGRHGPKSVPSNKLSATERQRIVAVATSIEFRDESPKQIVPSLADRGEYIGSESTFYRVLHAENLQHRRSLVRAPTHRPREHVADGPWQVASWDITYLKSHVRGEFFFLYLVDRHAGRDVKILASRRAVYQRAKRRHPERLSRHSRRWRRPATVALKPRSPARRSPHRTFCSMTMRDNYLDSCRKLLLRQRPAVADRLSPSTTIDGPIEARPSSSSAGSTPASPSTTIDGPIEARHQQRPPAPYACLSVDDDRRPH
jgi:hypothetical protein